MRAISLWQPWASYVAHGVKRIETRSWPANYEGQIAIHAAKKWTKEQKILADSIFKKLPSEKRKFFLGYPPRGRIICVCRIVDCYQMTQEIVDNCKEHNPLEYSVGEWSAGRWAWVLDEVQLVVPTIETRGRQSFWTFKNKDLDKYEAKESKEANQQFDLFSS